MSEIESVQLKAAIDLMTLTIFAESMMQEIGGTVAHLAARLIAARRSSL